MFGFEKWHEVWKYCAIHKWPIIHVFCIYAYEYYLHYFWCNHRFNKHTFWIRFEIEYQPTPVFLPGESQGQGNLVGCCLWGRRVGHDWSDLAAAVAATNSLEKEMATHSSVLAWRIPGTGERGGLLSLGSQSQTRLKQLSSSSSSIFILTG